MKKITIQLWGVRGSYLVAAKAWRGFAGNTCCLEINYAATKIIVDAGTGVVQLGQKLARSEKDLKTTILFSHYHLDHVSGLPSFLPLCNDRAHITLAGPKLWQGGVKHVLNQLIAPPYFSRPLAKSPARLKYLDLSTKCFKIDDVKITPILLNHPGNAFAYRFDFPGNRSFCFAPVSELDPACMQNNIIKWAKGADLFIHDAYFTDHEYGKNRGCGHSSISKVLQVVKSAEVKKACLLHHTLGYNDSMFKKLAAKLPQNCAFAREGMKFSL